MPLYIVRPLFGAGSVAAASILINKPPEGSGSGSSYSYSAPSSTERRRGNE